MKAVILAIAMALPAAADGFRAGVSRVDVTPPLPFWLSGYAARTNPAATVQNRLWAKALAIDDGAGGRVVIVTADLIGFPREMTDEAASRLRESHGLRRDQVLFNTSHTHYGPVVRSNLSALFSFDAAEQTRIHEYGRRLVDDLVAVVGAAMADLAPARLDSGHGRATIAVNRREPAASGVKLGINPAGPVDPDVPVLRVTAPDGRLRAVLFGYACHGTSLQARFTEIDSDFGGFAQRSVETTHPGATALYMILCAGDQNPNPRGEYSRMEQHGRDLAAAVESALAGPLRAVQPPVRTAHRIADLDFAPHTRATFEREAAGEDGQPPSAHKKRRAQRMLAAYDRGEPVRTLPLQAQAIRLGADFTLVGISGEVVVDYALRLKREFPRENLVVAGYCNDVSCYIPSLEVLRGGGYEPETSMIYYGQPGPLSTNVEESVIAAAREALHDAGAP